MRAGNLTAREWEARRVKCRLWDKEMQTNKIGRHMREKHNMYERAQVAAELLEVRPPVLYTATQTIVEKGLSCPFPDCPFALSSPYILRRHFHNLNPCYHVRIPSEGHYPRCKACLIPATYGKYITT